MKHKRNRKKLPKVTVQELLMLKKLLSKNKKLLLEENSDSSSDSDHENSKAVKNSPRSPCSPISKLVSDSSSDSEHENSKGGPATTHSSPVLKLQTSTANSDYENVSSDEFDDINEECPVNTKGEITIDLFTNSTNSSSDSEHDNSKGGSPHTSCSPVPLPPTTNIEIDPTSTAPHLQPPSTTIAQVPIQPPSTSIAQVPIQPPSTSIAQVLIQPPSTTIAQVAIQPPSTTIAQVPIQPPSTTIAQVPIDYYVGNVSNLDSFLNNEFFFHDGTVTNNFDNSQGVTPPPRKKKKHNDNFNDGYLTDVSDIEPDDSNLGDSNVIKRARKYKILNGTKQVPACFDSLRTNTISKLNKNHVALSKNSLVTLYSFLNESMSQLSNLQLSHLKAFNKQIQRQLKLSLDVFLHNFSSVEEISPICYNSPNVSQILNKRVQQFLGNTSSQKKM